MSRSVNRVILLGNLVRDAEQKFTPSGVSITNMTVATNRRVKDGDQWKDEAEFHRVVMFRNENLAPYLLKGKQVYIEGRLQTRKYEKDGVTHYATEVVCDDVILLSGSGDKREKPATQPQRTTAAVPHSQPDGAGFGISADDVPFARYDPPCL